ncbi:MAG: rhodanese-like domain-containing protein [Desulfobacteraceae bacterium]|nr:rhodanese-like domain-containing protein [Desulfobacteraceae bacterium]
MKHSKGIIILLIVSVVLSFTYNYFSPSGISLVGDWDRTKGVVSANAKTSVIKRDREINNSIDMKKIVEDSYSLIVDARLEESYIKGHIPGARSIPLSQFGEFIGSFYETVPLERKIVVYCSSRECTDSHALAQKLSEVGYENIQVFSGGFVEWEQGGYQIEKN